jgi:phage-related protein
MGYALYAAQQGEMDPAAKPMKGFGGSTVLEIRSDLGSGTWRTVYSVQFKDAIYVLHAFQKKSKRGIATPRIEIERIHARLRAAETDYKKRLEHK